MENLMTAGEFIDSMAPLDPELLAILDAEADLEPRWCTRDEDELHDDDVDRREAEHA